MPMKNQISENMCKFTCAVMSQPSSKQTKTEEPFSSTSDTTTASCIIL